MLPDSNSIEFDLINHLFRAEEKWVAKLLRCEEWEKVRANSCTIRQFFKVFGSLVWNSYSVRSPLCYLPSSLSFIRDVARTTTQSPEAWDLPLEIRSSVLAELSLRMCEVEANAWQGVRPSQEVSVWSDASQEGWAAVLESEKETVAQGLFSENPDGIFLLKKFLRKLKPSSSSPHFLATKRCCYLLTTWLLYTAFNGAIRQILFLI